MLEMSKIKVRQATIEDINEYIRLQEERWADNNQANKKQLLTRLRVHPAGMLVAEMGGNVVGMVYVMRIANYDYDNPPSWYEITNNGACDNHVPDGPIIFGVDLSTAKGVGGAAGDELLLGVARLAIRENIKWSLLGGRMPGYHKYKDKMTADEYLLAKAEDGKPLDYQVRYYTGAAGLNIVKALPNYFDDPDSCDYGVLLRWRNPLYGWPLRKVWAAIFPFLYQLETFYLKLTTK
jgi:hypothetical protein